MQFQIRDPSSEKGKSATQREVNNQHLFFRFSCQPFVTACHIDVMMMMMMMMMMMTAFLKIGDLKTTTLHIGLSQQTPLLGTLDSIALSV